MIGIYHYTLRGSMLTYVHTCSPPTWLMNYSPKPCHFHGVHQNLPCWLCVLYLQFSVCYVPVLCFVLFYISLYVYKCVSLWNCKTMKKRKTKESWQKEIHCEGLLLLDHSLCIKKFICECASESSCQNQQILLFNVYGLKDSTLCSESR